MSLETDIEVMVDSLGLVLYDTVVTSENGETIYRVTVLDKDSKNVTLDKCVELTHLISPMLDVTPPIGGEYRLEVSSPGLERKLTTLKHFQYSIGDLVKMTTKDQKKINGILKDVCEQNLYFEIDLKEVVIPFNDIIKARTYVKW